MKSAVGCVWMLGLALAAVSSGCMSVADLSDRANAKELAPGEIKGFIVDTTNRHIPRAIVVSYTPIRARAMEDDPVLLIPTDSVGRPVVGKKDAIPMPTDADFKSAATAYHSRYFTTEDPRHPGVQWQTSQIFSGPVEFKMIAQPYVGNQRANIGEPDLVLYLQFRVPRSQRDIDADRSRAALLTPPTAVFEFLFMPIGGLIWYLAVASSQ